MARASDKTLSGSSAIPKNYLTANEHGFTTDYSASGDSTTTCTPRVDGRQLITCARSILVISLPAACQSFTQNVRVAPWIAKVEPSIITGTGSATVPWRSASSNSGINGLNLSNWTSTAASSISAGGNSTGSLDSSNKRVSVCSFRFLTTGMTQIRLNFS